MGPSWGSCFAGSAVESRPLTISTMSFRAIRSASSTHRLFYTVLHSVMMILFRDFFFLSSEYSFLDKEFSYMI